MGGSARRVAPFLHKDADGSFTYPYQESTGTEPPLVPVCDPTHQRDEWVALTVSVVYRAQAIPVAWHVVKADAPGSWMAAPVLCDRGLGSRDLWARIRELGWHPVLRHSPAIAFRPTGRDRVPVRQLGGGPGPLRVGAGEAFADKPLPGTLIVLHAQDCDDPWVLPADTRRSTPEPPCTPAATGGQGFRGLKRGGWQWGRTRHTDPVRVARHLLRGHAPGRLLQHPVRGCPRPPTAAPSKSVTPRRFSLLRQGTAGLRCLSPPVA